MKVCVLTTSFPRNANDSAGIFVARLLEAMGRVGLSGSVVVPRDADEPRQEEYSGWRVVRFRYGLFSRGALAFGNGVLPNLRKRPVLILQLPGLMIAMMKSALLQVRESDVILANWILSAFPAFLLGLLTGKPFCVVIRGEDAKILHHPLLKVIALWLLRRSAAVICVNKRFKGELERKGLKQLHTVENGVTVGNEGLSPEDRRRLKLPEHAGRVFLGVGRLIRLKRIELVIDVFSHLATPADILLIVGPANDPEYRDQLDSHAAGSATQNQIMFVGEVSPAEVSRFYRSSDVFITASAYEGKPNALKEALAHGLLCLASDIEGHRELLSDNENGLLFRSESLAEDCLRLKALLRDPERVKELRDGAQRSLQGSSWEACAHNYQKVLSTVLK